MDNLPFILMCQTWSLIIKNVSARYCASSVGKSCEEDRTLALQSLHTSTVALFLTQSSLTSVFLTSKIGIMTPGKAGQHSSIHLLSPPITAQHSMKIAASQEAGMPNMMLNPGSSLSLCWCMFLPWPFFHFLCILADVIHPLSRTGANLQRRTCPSFSPFCPLVAPLPLQSWKGLPPEQIQSFWPH